MQKWFFFKIQSNVQISDFTLPNLNLICKDFYHQTLTERHNIISSRKSAELKPNYSICGLSLQYVLDDYH